VVDGLGIAPAWAGKMGATFLWDIESGRANIAWPARLCYQ